MGGGEVISTDYWLDVPDFQTMNYIKIGVVCWGFDWLNVPDTVQRTPASISGSLVSGKSILSTLGPKNNLKYLCRWFSLIDF